MTIFVETTKRNSYTASLYKNGSYVSVNLYFPLYERRIFGTFFMGCRIFTSLADGPTLWLSVAVCSSITLDFEIRKIKQSVRYWWICESVWIVKQNKVCQIDVIHKLEGIFLNLPKGKNKNLLWKNMGTNFFRYTTFMIVPFLLIIWKVFFCLLIDLKE